MDCADSQLKLIFFENAIILLNVLTDVFRIDMMYQKFDKIFICYI